MSADTLPFIARNLRNQPTELHLGRRVVVVPPRGAVDLSEADRATPQVRVLERRRLITVEPRNAKLNLNSATVAQLDQLPGISTNTAQAIVEYRAEHGPFARIEDVQRVRGVGTATGEALAEHVVIRR